MASNAPPGGKKPKAGWDALDSFAPLRSATRPAARQRPLPDARICGGEFHGVPSLARNIARAIERGHAMRTDGEIERLKEMPADSIAAATTKIGPRHVPLAALR